MRRSTAILFLIYMAAAVTAAHAGPILDRFYEQRIPPETEQATPNQPFDEPAASFPRKRESSEQASSPTSGAQQPTQPAIDETAMRALAHDLEEYQQQAETYEQQGGPYDPRLREALLGIGLIQKRTGDYAEAVKTFARALHISHVNDGPENIVQAPLLQLQVECNRALHDYDALDKNYDALLWVYRRNWKPEFAPLVQQIADARLAAYQADVNGRGFVYLMKADIIYDDLLEDVKDLPANQEPRRTALYHRAQLNYLIGEAALDFAVSFTELREGLLEGKRDTYGIKEQDVRREVSDEALLKSKYAITQVLKATEANQDTDPVAYAEALVFYGDWNLVQRSAWYGMRQYRKAWEVLKTHEVAQAEFDRLFGAPVRIRPPPIPGKPAPEENGSDPYADALVTVPDDGWPEDIRIVKTWPAKRTELAERAYRGIRHLRFRPRIEADSPVATQDVPVRYTFRN